MLVGQGVGERSESITVSYGQRESRGNFLQSAANSDDGTQQVVQSAVQRLRGLHVTIGHKALGDKLRIAIAVFTARHRRLIYRLEGITSSYNNAEKTRTIQTEIPIFFTRIQVSKLSPMYARPRWASPG